MSRASSTYVLALDEGTTGTTALLFDRDGRVAARAYREFTQHYPEPGWVEHDAVEIWEATLTVAREALDKVPGGADSVAAIGITNQRETAVVWEAATGQPIAPAIVWQCRRTAQTCEELKAAGLEQEIRAKTGLVLDAYFSASKVKWLLDKVPGARRRAEAGELRFGTIDSWLTWNLTGGRVHVTDLSNASRTMLFDLRRLAWDEDLLRIFDVPQSLLPAVRPSSEVYGYTDRALFGREIPVAGLVGDQQAATFGQACFRPGMAKMTYGTGGFLLLPVGPEPVWSKAGLLTTVAWGLGGKVEYALEGSVFVAGACVQWLRDGLGIIKEASETEALACQVADTGGVYLVPAFVGLGAPYWDMYARGTIVGVTRDTGRAHLARAALEAIAYQTRDVLEAMQSDTGQPLARLRVDGGAAANDFLMQFQADALGVPVERPYCTDTTGLGAAYLAGLAVGYWESPEDILNNWRRDRLFQPQLPEERRAAGYAGWRRAVDRSRDWARD